MFAPPPPDFVALPGPGTRIGPYEVVKPLGAGGMAQVFLARRQGPGDFLQQVALKRLQSSGDPARQRLLNEGALLSRLRHPHIGQVHGIEEHDGTLYLVLEHINGAPVSDLIDLARRQGRRLSEPFACHVASQIADALDYAHALADESGRPLGIVHRDLSADNVMLDAFGMAKLIDFGLARSRLPSRLPTPGGFKGKYCYASPEQLARGPLDGRSDLFSLGLVLVELATGQRLFDDGDPGSTLLRIHRTDPREVEHGTRGLSEGLRAIIARALARSPGKRFQTGLEFRLALMAFMAEHHPLYGNDAAAAECAEVLGLGEAEQVDPTPAPQALRGRRLHLRTLAGLGAAGVATLAAMVLLGRAHPVDSSPSALLARGWNGLVPGQSTREDVVRMLGEPSETGPGGDDELLTWSGHKSIRGTREVQVYIEPATRRVQQIVVHPKPGFDQVLVESAYGHQCRPGQVVDTCYENQLLADWRTVWHYRRLGTSFVFDSSRQVDFIIYLPPPLSE